MIRMISGMTFSDNHRIWVSITNRRRKRIQSTPESMVLFHTAISNSIIVCIYKYRLVRTKLPTVNKSIQQQRCLLKRAEEINGVLQARNEAIHFVNSVVEIKARSCTCVDAQMTMERLRAVVPRPHCNPMLHSKSPSPQYQNCKNSYSSAHNILTAV